jgi:hypothetical protein
MPGVMTNDSIEFSIPTDVMSLSCARELASKLSACANSNENAKRTIVEAIRTGRVDSRVSLPKIRNSELLDFINALKFTNGIPDSDTLCNLGSIVLSDTPPIDGVTAAYGEIRLVKQVPSFRKGKRCELLGLDPGDSKKLETILDKYCQIHLNYDYDELNPLIKAIKETKDEFKIEDRCSYAISLIAVGMTMFEYELFEQIKDMFKPLLPGMYAKDHMYSELLKDLISSYSVFPHLVSDITLCVQVAFAKLENGDIL